MKRFDINYFKRYSQKNILGIEKGEKPFLYSFWMRKLNELIPKGAKVLEVGCGGGYFLRWLEKRYNVIGIDISSETLELARKRTNAFVYIADAHRLPFKENEFYAVIAFDLVEHLEFPQEFFKEAYRVLRLAGLLIISTPNPASFGARIKSRGCKHKEISYEQRLMEWYGWRDDTHINIKPIDEWRKIFKESGFVILKDGTDTLWDVPYFKCIPTFAQKIFFLPFHYILTYIFGFLPWRYGENYVCIARKL